MSPPTLSRVPGVYADFGLCFIPPPGMSTLTVLPSTVTAALPELIASVTLSRAVALPWNPVKPCLRSSSTLPLNEQTMSFLVRSHLPTTTCVPLWSTLSSLVWGCSRFSKTLGSLTVKESPEVRVVLRASQSNVSLAMSRVYNGGFSSLPLASDLVSLRLAMVTLPAACAGATKPISGKSVASRTAMTAGARRRPEMTLEVTVFLSYA